MRAVGNGPDSGRSASDHRLLSVSMLFSKIHDLPMDLQVKPRPYGPLPEVGGLVKFLSCGLSLAFWEFSENEDALPLGWFCDTDPDPRPE